MDLSIQDPYQIRSVSDVNIFKAPPLRRRSFSVSVLCIQVSNKFLVLSAIKHHWHDGFAPFFPLVPKSMTQPSHITGVTVLPPFSYWFPSQRSARFPRLVSRSGHRYRRPSICITDPWGVGPFWYTPVSFCSRIHVTSIVTTK